MNKVNLFFNLTTPSICIDSAALVNMVIAPTNKVKVEKIREAKANGDKKQYEELKKSLPAFTYAATFKGRRTLENINTFEYVCGMDFDHIGNPQKINRIKEKLKKDKLVNLMFTSPSGDGLKVFVKLEKDEKVEKMLENKEYEKLSKYYADKFNQISNYFEGKYSIKSDPSVKDIPRLCFLSHDPEVYYNKDSQCFSIDEDKLMEIYENHIIESPNQEGNRNNSLYGFCQKAFAAGYDKGTIREFSNCKYSGLGNEEFEKTLKSASTSKKAKRKNNTKKDIIINTGETSNHAILELFHKRFEIRFNDIMNCFEILDKESDKKTWVTYDLIMDNTIYSYITNHNEKARKISISRILKTNEVEKFNPFTQKLNSLPTWDGVDYIEQLADKVKTTNQEEWKEDLKKYLVAIVATLLNPKTINHYCLVLLGKEGIGKTSFIKLLVPKEWEDYFTQSPLTLRHKDTNFKLSQNFLISIEELSKYNRNEFNDVKEVITRDSIQEREHFGKEQKKFVRNASFIATLNDKQFLSGEEGERRFWAHEMTEIDYEAEIDIDLVYAQALALHKDNFKYWETKEDIEKRKKKNEEFVTTDPVLEMLNLNFTFPETEEDTSPHNKPQYYTSTEVLDIIQRKHIINHKEISTLKIGRALSRLKLEVRKSNGCKRYLLSEKSDIEKNRDNKKDEIIV